MIECPTCKGAKKQTVRVVGGAISSFQMDCFSCKGTGEISEQMVTQLKTEQGLWCKCKASHGSRYVPDGQSREVRKHHWRCNKCGKVTQIG